VARACDGRAGFRRVLPVIATVLVGIPALAATVDARSAVPLFDVDSQALRPVVTAVRRAVADRPGPVLIDVGRRRAEDQYELGLQLERAGHPVTVRPAFPSRYGVERTRARRSYGTHLVVVGPLDVPVAPRGARLIARSRVGWSVYEVPPDAVR
jgi:hypothetical protein